MDLTELEVRASKGEEFPPHLTFEERTLFGNFRCLYFLLKNKQVSIEEAKKEKQNYLQQYQKLKMIIKQYEDDTERKSAIYDIINKYGGVRNVPPNTLEMLCRMIDCCLVVEVKKYGYGQGSGTVL